MFTTEDYSKYTIKQFWDWWSNGEPAVMEVRILNFELIKEVAKKFYIPYSVSGVYVDNDAKLKNVIAYCRDKAVMWFGINPRKKNYNKFGTKSFAGDDYHIQSISFIFIDIDRIVKKGPATIEELNKANKLADNILEKLKEQNFSDDYIKICSGNGVQMLIRLDIPIYVPLVDYDEKEKIYIDNNEFEKTKQVIRRGVGQQIASFAKRYEKELDVSVDTTGFRMGSVAALPCTKNYKYDGFTWRGVIDMKNGINNGLSDYILTYLDNVEDFKEKNFFIPASNYISKQNYIRKGKLLDNPLAKYLYENDFPEGGINNSLWFQLKMLMRDSNVDFRSSEFKSYHKYIQQKHGRSFTLNIPEKKHRFSESTVNMWCIQNKYPLVYEYLGHRKKKQDYKLEKVTMDMISSKDSYTLSVGTIFDDMKWFKENHLVIGDYNNRTRMGMFIKACVDKYGEKTTEYYVNNLFARYMTYG